MNEFGDLLGTPYAPVSKIAPVKAHIAAVHLKFNFDDMYLISLFNHP